MPRPGRYRLADGVYASAAVGLGSAAAQLLPATRHAQAVSAVILGGVAGWMLRSALIPPNGGTQAAPRSSPLWRTTAKFLALTIVNPVTVVYFSALVTGLDGTVLRSAANRSLFALAACVASLSWQLSLAAAGTVAGHRLTERSRRVLHAGRRHHRHRARRADGTACDRVTGADQPLHQAYPETVGPDRWMSTRISRR